MSDNTRPESEQEPDTEQEQETEGSTEAPNWTRARKELDRLIGWSLDLVGMLFIFFVLGFMSEGCTITTSTHEYSVGIIGNGGPHMTSRPLHDKGGQDAKQEGSKQEGSKQEGSKQEGSKQEAKTTP